LTRLGRIKKGIDIAKGDFSFAQINDGHIGFNKPANPDVVGTLQATISKINAMPSSPSFILHTGDLSHLAQADEFDTLDQSLKSAKTGKIFYVPGEHDVLVIMANNIFNVTAKTQKATAGIVLISTGYILSAL
jgi:3',5'-cyclic AMP phosphodiesterase CpdA